MRISIDSTQRKFLTAVNARSVRKYLSGLIAAATLSCQLVHAQYAPNPPLINVSGTAEIKVAPDEVHISVGVETHDENLANAKSQNDEKMAAALKFLKEAGIADKDVQTDFIQIEPNYDDRNNNNPLNRIHPVYYVVRKNISITLRKVTEFDKVLSGLISSGINNVQNIEFESSQLRLYRDRARQMAVRAAKEKANALAGELGVKVGRPQSISSRDGNVWNGYNMKKMAEPGGGADSSEGTFSIGQISVSATVDVSFLIAQP